MERISPLRKRIDEIDEQILRSLKERVEVCETIGAIKREHKIPVTDASRESELNKHLRERAASLALSPSHIEAVYREIVVMCKYVQERNAKT